MKHAERREATRQVILEAAEVLFAEKGFDGTTIEDIVRTARVARGTFYYNFATKEDLVMAIARRDFAHTSRTIEEQLAVGKSPVDLFRQLFVAASQWHVSNHHLSRVVLTYPFNQLTQPPPTTSSETEPSFRRLSSQLLEAGQKQGAIRVDLPAETLGQIAAGIFVQAALFAHHQSEMGQLELWVDRFLAVFFDGARAPWQPHPDRTGDST